MLCELVLVPEGHVLQYRLLTSSGSLLFDQSAMDALGKVTQVRAPPDGMDHTIVVKFFPPAEQAHAAVDTGFEFLPAHPFLADRLSHFNHRHLI